MSSDLMILRKKLVSVSFNFMSFGYFLILSFFSDKMSVLSLLLSRSMSLGGWSTVPFGLNKQLWIAPKIRWCLRQTNWQTFFASYGTWLTWQLRVSMPSPRIQISVIVLLGVYVLVRYQIWLNEQKLCVIVRYYTGARLYLRCVLSLWCTHVTLHFVGDSDYVSNRCAFSDGTVLNLVVVLKLIINKWKRCKVFSI